MASSAHHVYLSPGMFGFARLAAYDYFAHVERALSDRFGRAGQPIELHVVDVLPTASVRRRAGKLADLIAQTATGQGPLALFTAIHRITSQSNERYPCARLPTGAGEASAVEQTLTAAFEDSPKSNGAVEGNDGVVPIRSQLWGTLAWAGLADHLDVLGHYEDNSHEPRPELRHRDWLTSGSSFGATQFATLMDAISSGMLHSS